MLYRYALFVVMIIILLIMGLMFFYFTNQINYQNNKISAMFSIVTDLIQKDIQPLEIPFPTSTLPPNFEFTLPQPSNLIEVSDSEDDDDDDDDDDDETTEVRAPIVFETQCVDEKGVSDIQYIDISDIIQETETQTEADDIMKSDEKEVGDAECLEELPSFNKIDDVAITTIQSDTKHSIEGSHHHHHKSLHVNELRKMAVQLQLVQNVEAKKLKKDDLIDLLAKSTGNEAKL